MGIVIKCGKSIETIKSVLYEIERKMPNVLWTTGTSPASWSPKIVDDESYVALFINDNLLTFAEDSEEYIERYISSYYGNDDIIYAEDFIDGETGEEEIENETDISFLFN